MKILPIIVELLKTKQTKEILEQHTQTKGAFDLNAALASAQTRLLKGIELAEKGEVIPFGNKECTFIVDKYLVTADAPVISCTCKAPVHCQCEDHKHRQGRCKHILAAGLYVRANKVEKEKCNV